ncbi:uncharacterized protein LOC133795934 isoform X2 [Humulus lupulus]|uniref:uncharacterized protein LOC133795934 isoform X2 n=1 Tax=Humulus lupulus TaxID=3486 RepID=UPI002B400FB7|nr:uncharacterized protein LOC133795934 isoform X2 [Humulus lupulus]
MSRRDRESDSKRHRSRFDREPSPKRSRRDGKPVPERLPSSDSLDIKNITEQGQKHHRSLQERSPLKAFVPTDSKPEKGALSNDIDRQPNGQHEGTKLSAGPTDGPRPRSYFQHDERGNAARVGRSSGRNTTSERGWWRDSRDQHNERTENRKSTNETWKRDDRAKGDEKANWRHDRFSEVEADAPPARKRPSFREKKIQADSEQADRAAPETVKSSHLEQPAKENRKEEQGHNTRYFDRTERPLAGDGAANRREPQRGGFLSRERYRGGGGDDDHRRRDGFSGGRPVFRGGSHGHDKWKHDLYQEANRSPTPKNEEDQIAKVEALLAS